MIESINYDDKKMIQSKKWEMAFITYNTNNVT